MSVHYMDCCAVQEIGELSDMSKTEAGAKEFINDLMAEVTEGGYYEQIYDWETNTIREGEYIPEERKVPAFYIFTQAGNEKDVNATSYGEYFKDYIERHDLGDVVVVGPQKNPNSGNMVNVYVWTTNQEALLKWEVE